MENAFEILESSTYDNENVLIKVKISGYNYMEITNSILDKNKLEYIKYNLKYNLKFKDNIIFNKICNYFIESRKLHHLNEPSYEHYFLNKELNQLYLATKIYYYHNMIHRINAPALVRYINDGSKDNESYYNNGLIHNLNGPAIIYFNDKNKITIRNFYLYGKYIPVRSFKQFKKYLKLNNIK